MHDYLLGPLAACAPAFRLCSVTQVQVVMCYRTLRLYLGRAVIRDCEVEPRASILTQSGLHVGGNSSSPYDGVGILSSLFESIMLRWHGRMEHFRRAQTEHYIHDKHSWICLRLTSLTPHMRWIHSSSFSGDLLLDLTLYTISTTEFLTNIICAFLG